MEGHRERGGMKEKDRGGTKGEREREGQIEGVTDGERG